MVFVPKYRRNIFYGMVKEDCEKVIHDICGRHGYKVISLHVAPDHVHLFIEFPPSVPLSSVVKQLKGESAVRLFRMHPELKKKLWGGHLWTAGKFYRSVGNVTADTIKHYINESQLLPEPEDEKQTSLRHFY